MDPNINNNQNIKENNSLIHQIEIKENYNNIDSNLNPNIKIIHLKKKGKNNDFSSDFINSENFINKKRIKPEEEEKKVNILNKNGIPQIPFNSIVFLNHEIQKKMKKKLEIEEDIQKHQKELNKLKFEIEYFEKIDNFLKNFDIDKEVIKGGKDENKNSMKIYVDDSLEEKKIFSLNKYSNPLRKLYKTTSIRTINLSKENKSSENKIKNEKYPIFENNSNENKNIGNPFLNMETIKENYQVSENNNINNRMDKEMDPYSFRILANDNFHYRISKGEKKLSIEFIIENNGKLAWPENETFLLIDENKSAFKIKKIYLFPLQPQEQCFVDFEFKDLDKYKPGLYKNYLVFNVKGKDYGDNIIIDIEIY